jgi:hypothetical protein
VKSLSFSLTSSSIKKTIKKLSKFKDNFDIKVSELYLKKCCESIRDLADQYIGTTIEDVVLQDQIRSSWQYEVHGNSAKLINTSEKAVFLEFGFGIKGAESGYPQEYEPSQYQYDVESRYKSKKDRSWSFSLAEGEPLDVNEKNILKQWTTKGGRLVILTRGQAPLLFVYNAVMNFRDNKVYKEAWEETLKELEV